MTGKAEWDTVSPMLAAVALPRIGEPTIEGYFCQDRDVWVVQAATGVRPLILSVPDAGQTKTITRVRTEQDDSDEGLAATVSTSTFTKVNAEGHDSDVSCSGLLEVTTKTHAQLESDDHTTTLEAFAPAAEAGERSWSVPIQ